MTAGLLGLPDATNLVVDDAPIAEICAALEIEPDPGFWGDGDGHPTPYLDVGPWSGSRPGPGSYWNAPFGAIVGSDAPMTAGRGGEVLHDRAGIPPPGRAGLALRVP